MSDSGHGAPGAEVHFVGRLPTKRRVGQHAIVQVDNATPIVLNLDKSNIHGIRGSVGP
jgi:hypothetical protein